jgi:hypothetical protein
MEMATLLPKPSTIFASSVLEEIDLFCTCNIGKAATTNGGLIRLSIACFPTQMNPTHSQGIPQGPRLLPIIELIIGVR